MTVTGSSEIGLLGRGNCEGPPVLLGLEQVLAKDAGCLLFHHHSSGKFKSEGKDPQWGWHLLLHIGTPSDGRKHLKQKHMHSQSFIAGNDELLTMCVDELLNSGFC